jgi:dTDP-4-amino-4,6-dideoxygalactose transaminase
MTKTETMLKWPHYDDDQIADVVSVLKSGQVNAWTGAHVANFESAYARFLGRRHAVGLANGTLALDLALRIIGVGPGDEVIVTPRSFIASASCVPLTGATPVFADVDPDSQNISAETIRPHITPRTRAIIAVHLAGWPCDMDTIMELARGHNIYVIEDCAQAHGAEYRGRPVGSFGHMAAFSFCQDKIITTGGEGGLLAMDDAELWQAAWSFKDHGKSYNAVFNVQHPPGFRWLHESFGTNWRMTSIQAVIGLRQLERLAQYNRTRATNAGVLLNEFRSIEALRTPIPNSEIRHAYYRLYAFVRPERLKPDWNRDRIVSEVTAAGVPCFSGSCSEIYLEKAFSSRGLAPLQRLPQAAALGETSLAFLVDPCQDESRMMKVAATVREVVARATLQ